MSLKNFAVEKHVITVGDNSLELRGLSPNAVFSIVYENKDSIELIADLVEKAGFKDDKLPANEKLMELVGQVSLHAPFVIASIIAHGCGEPDAWENALHIPAPVQLEILTELARLTFTDRAGFERFLGNVKAAIAAVSQQRAPQTGDAG
jgi:hypothetical protein